MKTAAALLLVTLAVLACGCTGSNAAPAPAAANPQIPSLSGTWTGPMEGYDEGSGFTDYGGITMSMVITEQKGRLFAGHLIFRFNNTVSEVPMAGIIGRDGTSFSLVEKGSGYTTGTIVSGNEIELSWRDDKGTFGVAIDRLKRE